MVDITARLVYSWKGKAYPKEAQKATEDLGFQVLLETGKNGRYGLYVQAEQAVYEDVFSAQVVAYGKTPAFQSPPKLPKELAEYFMSVYFPTRPEFF